MKEAGAKTWRDAPAEEQQKGIEAGKAGGSRALNDASSAEKDKRRDRGRMAYAEANIEKQTYIRETGKEV